MYNVIVFVVNVFQMNNVRARACVIFCANLKCVVRKKMFYSSPGMVEVVH